MVRRRLDDGNIGDTEPGGLLLHLGQRLQEFLLPPEALPHDGAQRQVGQRPGDLPADVDRLVAGSGGDDGADKTGDLLLADRAERLTEFTEAH
ncbi:hypothetical protein E2562_017308 [Oryza meyeriana var. granulata]|uniref:Uncharacterized protein n=1 Tax=Oryza meyeriana var. granulata TaxID=110450 RepID=A0A6G1EM99_9ORYZ|nr:hypothetical protein E2562_017308 [Oryza meyeriana var. granulata]